MKKSNQQFLELLRSSLYEDKVVFSEDEVINWEDIYLLAQIHKCIPMIYGTSRRTSSFKRIDKRLRSEWQSISNTTAFAQMNKRNKFLELYKSLNEHNIESLIFKGMVISKLYPSYEKRNYMTEDILIKKESLPKVKELLKEHNFERKIAKEDRYGILSYYCPTSALYLKIHTHLFEDDYHHKDLLEEVFENLYEDKDSLIINNIKVDTFSIDKHFIYIIYNAIRDYINKTIRIRQIADITMFIDKKYNKLNWIYIWQLFEKMGYKNLVVAFMKISIDYLGLDKSKISYYKEENLNNINIEDLIIEILAGGFYGVKFIDYIDDKDEDILLEDNKSSFKTPFTCKRQTIIELIEKLFI